MKKIYQKQSYLLFVSVLVCQLSGIIAAYWTIPSLFTWYPNLQKPVFTPPNWVFAPVWTLLYLLMGISLYLIWRELYLNKKKIDKSSISFALEIFAIQLLFNIWWPVIFFGLNAPFTGMAEMAILLILIIITIVSFLRINRVSAYLLIPYILWTVYALVINISIVILN